MEGWCDSFADMRVAFIVPCLPGSFCDPGIDAAHAGSEQQPFASVQFGLDACADRDECSAVVLRDGTHYLSETIIMTDRHSHMTVMSNPGACRGPFAHPHLPAAHMLAHMRPDEMI